MCLCVCVCVCVCVIVSKEWDASEDAESGTGPDRKSIDSPLKNARVLASPLSDRLF